MSSLELRVFRRRSGAARVGSCARKGTATPLLVSRRAASSSEISCSARLFYTPDTKSYTIFLLFFDLNLNQSLVKGIRCIAFRKAVPFSVCCLQVSPGVSRADCAEAKRRQKRPEMFRRQLQSSVESTWPQRDTARKRLPFLRGRHGRSRTRRSATRQQWLQRNAG